MASNSEHPLDQIDQLSLGVSQLEYDLQSAELVAITKYPAALLSGKCPCALDSVKFLLRSQQRASLH